MIPTARNVDHLAYTVADLDAAIGLFAEVFGARLLYRQGPVRGDGDFMLRQLGVHPRASCFVSLLRLDPVTNLELFEYAAPGQRRRPPAPDEPGGHRLAFAVEDVEKAAGWAQARGFLDPVSAAAGTMDCVTPWGMPITLVRGVDVAPSSWPAALPGLRGVHHAGYAVPSVAEARAFLTTYLGAAASPGETSLRLGPVTALELIEERDPVGRHRPANSDVGGHHLALRVTDLDAAVAYLRSVPGVDVMGDPQVVDEGGPIDGSRWIYFRAPWGLQMELTQPPDHLPYERDTTARRYGPARSWSTP
jgi:2-epi-5-epi-valiolone epimerase